MLEVSDLSVGVRRRCGARQPVSLRGRGSITAVLGANGAGKTTLVRDHLRAGQGTCSGSIRAGGTEL